MCDCASVEFNTGQCRVATGRSLYVHNRSLWNNEQKFHLISLNFTAFKYDIKQSSRKIFQKLVEKYIFFKQKKICISSPKKDIKIKEESILKIHFFLCS